MKSKLTGKNVLVVDDDQSILSIFEFILKETGYNTITASSGQDCLDILKKGPKIDLVFLDVKMPGITGIDVFKQIQKTDPKLLVVMMTGYSEDELIKEVFELGAYGIIYKPFDMEEILSVVEKIFNI
jgi:DNA-binding NtrC family response regulator